jgi:uncharacterized membrane protein
MQAQRVETGHGWLWITHGYRLIMRNPPMSFALALLGALGMYLALQIPVAGVLLALLLMPVLLAGYMRVCRALEFHQKVEPTYLFEGFEKRTPQLLALGGLAMAGMIIISIIITIMGGSALAELLDSYRAAEDPAMLVEAMMSAGSMVALSLLTGLSLLFMLMLALQFAPMLVFFEQMSPFAALKASLTGSLRNIIPFTFYSLILQLFAILASYIPFDLGWVLLLPLGLTSMYVSYRDIFPTPEKSDSVIEASSDNEPTIPG